MKFEDSVWKLEDFKTNGNIIECLSKKGVNKLRTLEEKKVVFPNKLHGSCCCKKILSLFPEDWQYLDTNVDIIDLSNCVDLRVIAKSAFLGHNIREVIFRNCYNLNSIDAFAFSDNKITDLDLSDCKKLSKISSYAFANNKISKLCFCKNGDLEVINKKAFEKNNISAINFNDLPKLSMIGHLAFAENKLSDIDLSSIKQKVEISKKAFVLNPGAEHRQNLLLVNANNNINFSSAVHYNQIAYTELGVDDSAYKPIIEKKLVNNTSEWQSSDFKRKKDVIIGLNKTGYQKLISNCGYVKIVPPVNGRISKIDSSAFYNLGIKYLDLTACNDLCLIEKAAFNCNKIKDILFPKTKNLTIETYAFGNNKIQKLDFSMIDNVSVEDLAFANNNITHIDLSNKNQDMQDIDSLAFLDNKVESIKLYSIDKLNNISEAFIFEESVYKTVDVLLKQNLLNPYIRHNFIVNKSKIKRLEREWTEEDFVYKDGNITGLSDRGFETLYLNNGFLKLKEKESERCLSINYFAFKNLGLNGVDFSELKYLQSIKRGAFYRNAFNKVDLSKNHYLKEIAFSSNEKEALVCYYNISKELLDAILSEEVKLNELFPDYPFFKIEPSLFININDLTGDEKQRVKLFEEELKQNNKDKYAFIFDNDFRDIVLSWFHKPEDFNRISDFVFEETKIIKYNGNKNQDILIIPAYNLKGDKITKISKNIFDRDMNFKKIFIPKNLLKNINNFNIFKDNKDIVFNYY